MICSYSKCKKAAAICAAFLFLSPAVFANKGENITTFNGVRQKATELLIQKKKAQALQLVANYMRTQSGQPHRAEASELLVTIAQKFILREAQEAYENSLNSTLENPKESWRTTEQCLNLEPLQLDCLIQKLRLQLRAKNPKGAGETFQEIRGHVPGSRIEQWLGLLLQQGSPEFKDKQILKLLPDNGSEETMALAILELERAFAAKNYSRAKDLILFFEKRHADWPEIIFYKQKIDAESSESISGVSAEQVLVYKNKCKSLNKTTARKFRYDVHLCLRGAE